MNTYRVKVKTVVEQNRCKKSLTNQAVDEYARRGDSVWCELEKVGLSVAVAVMEGNKVTEYSVPRPTSLHLPDVPTAAETSLPWRRDGNCLRQQHQSPPNMSCSLARSANTDSHTAQGSKEILFSLPDKLIR